MKRIIFSICIIIFMIFPVGCKKNNPDEDKNQQFTVTIIYNSGFEDETYIVKYGEKLEEPAVKTIEHGTLKGYITSDGKDFSFDTPIKSNLTLYAKWEIEQVTVKFYDNDRTTLLYEVTQDYGTPLVYPKDPETKVFKGYKQVFNKWSQNINILTNDKVVYATYNTIYDMLDITVKNQDLEEIEVIEVKYSFTIKEPELPPITKEEGIYYQFIGWYDEATNELFDFEKEITEEHTIYPKYETGKIIETSLEDATISFLGDSISTFYSSYSSINSFYSGNNEYYYPIYSQTVKDVSDTWWYQLYKNLGVKLGINNSLSGSAAYGASSKAGCSNARLGTLDNNGIPNIVVIFLGTNDNVNGHTKTQLEEAYEKMITYINDNYVEERQNAYVIPKIYLINNGYSEYEGYSYSEAKRLEYNALFASLSKKYENVELFDLASLITQYNYSVYLGDRLHYNDVGMKLISDHLTTQIKKDFE